MQGGTMENNYEFTDLVGNDELIKDIRSLEEKIEQAIGDKVNLIAYSPMEDEWLNMDAFSQRPEALFFSSQVSLIQDDFINFPFWGYR